MTTRDAMGPTEQNRKYVNAKRFREKCGELMNEVARTGVELVVTKDGEPHVVISPMARRVGNTFIGSGRPHGVQDDRFGDGDDDALHVDLLTALTAPVPLIPASADIGELGAPHPALQVRSETSLPDARLSDDQERA